MNMKNMHNPTPKHQYDFALLWSESISERGYTRVPNLLLQYQAELNITPGEMCVLMQLLSFKWKAEMPYPSVRQVAERMGKSQDTVQRHTRSLESKGLLKRVPQPRDVHKGTNKYDTQPLVARLDKIADSHPNPLKNALSELAKLKTMRGAHSHPELNAAKNPYINKSIIGAADMQSRQESDL